MQVVHTVADLRAALAEFRATAFKAAGYRAAEFAASVSPKSATTQGRMHAPDALSAAPLETPQPGSVGFVPTMGNLHAGHIALVEHARRHSAFCVASVFINPLQFGANEDFSRYPRTLAADCAALDAAGCDLVFAPDAADLYPAPQTFHVAPPPDLADTLCGKFRPGHFAGVATVVLKLFNLVAPTLAVFGKKDYQQLAVIRGLVREFNLPIAVHGLDTVRDADGLARSSRNQYLSAADRPRASQLYAELRGIADAVARGETDTAHLANRAGRHLKMAGWDVDYVAVRDADTLAEPLPNSRLWVALAAARLGTTRLIDNLEIAVPS
jgi:pantoate--beta-alanine ligase